MYFTMTHTRFTLEQRREHTTFIQYLTVGHGYGRFRRKLTIT